jgi:hypothetical protein
MTAAKHAELIAALREIPKGPAREAEIGLYARTSGRDVHEIRAEVEGSPIPRLRIRTAASIEPSAVDWLWKPQIPLARLSLLVGDPSAGKSTLSCVIAAAVTTAMPLPGDSAMIDPSPVVMFSAEDGAADTIRPRLEAAGADLELVHIVEALEILGMDEALTLKRRAHLDALERALIALRPALVVVDPLTAYLGDADSFKDAEIRGILTPLAALAERYGCAILAIMHLRKSSADRALHRVSGSIAFGAAARSVLLAGSEPDAPDVRALVHLKSNLSAVAPPEGYRIECRSLHGGRIETSAVVWTGASELTAARLLAPEADGGPSKEAEDFLRTELEAVERPARDVIAAARASGITEKILRGARERLRVKVRKEGFGAAGTWLWSLPAKDAFSPYDARASMEKSGASGAQALRRRRASCDGGGGH